MSEENKEKIIEALGNNTLSQLNINGIVQAAKFYSLHLANQQYDEMAEEDREKILENIKNEFVLNQWKHSLTK